MAKAQVDRVIFQYSDRCNMACPYCYCPFFGRKVDQRQAMAVVKRCRELGARVITFGGGDPFMYEGFRELARDSCSSGMSVHVDTNGIGLTSKDHDMVSECVSLLSLPIDGPDEDVQTQMRGRPGHFTLVTGLLEDLSVLRRTRWVGKLKINTVVSAVNHRAIDKIGLRVRDHAVDIWSLMQFWPLGSGAKARQTYDISDLDYLAAVDGAKAVSGDMRVEYGVSSKRGNHHFFVTHDGVVYTHDRNDRGKYVFLGSVFDDCVVDSWVALCSSSIHPVSVHRYAKDARLGRAPAE